MSVSAFFALGIGIGLAIGSSAVLLLVVGIFARHMRPLGWVIIIGLSLFLLSRL